MSKNNQKPEIFHIKDRLLEIFIFIIYFKYNSSVDLIHISSINQQINISNLNWDIRILYIIND